MKHILTSLLIILFTGSISLPQERKQNPPPMLLNVGNFNLSMNRLMGDGGLQSQFSWNLTGDNRQSTEIFYWPQDIWQSNMLYQIFNPVSLDDNGITDENNRNVPMMLRGNELTNFGINDWAYEIRRYRPPHVIVDGIPLDAPYQWYVDPALDSDIKVVFEDVLPQFGIRSHVEISAFSNPEQADYFIWKATHKFTGEWKIPRNSALSTDTIPDQTIRFWWPVAFSFGPSKAGERYVNNNFSYEGEDDLDSWFKRKSELVTGKTRDSLYVAYYYDYYNTNTLSYSNGSNDDTGDPDRNSGFLHSTQVPGYTLLYADKSNIEKTDDPAQPYSLPHATISGDLWGRRDFGLKLTYRGDDSRGRFPLDPITEGFSTAPQKGPMRFITCGPYELTKNAAAGRFDSVTFVYAVGVGGMEIDSAAALGRAWLNKEITDAQKNDSILAVGTRKLWHTMDNANWAFTQMQSGGKVPSAPPSPDIEVVSGPNIITINWSYPEASYYNDAVTGVPDWAGWKVYRKEGALLVNDPSDKGTGKKWQLIYTTNDKNVNSFIDSTVVRGIDYYYAVTAVDDGTLNTSLVNPGMPLESSRFITRSLLPAVSYKPGLSTSANIRVVPNPATVASGKGLLAGNENKISFFNLPVKCTLTIFTETGNQVVKIEHYGTADHEWNQLTDTNQFVTSGIYILAATDCEDLLGNKLDNQFVKFIIVR